MRKLSANLILPVTSPPLKNGIITLDENGKILDLTDTEGNLKEEAGLEFHAGVIVPGFIIPWIRLGDLSLNHFDQQLALLGIKGVGLLLSESQLSEEGLQLMSASRLIYHPIIELNPNTNHFDSLNRGIDLISRAFNEFNIFCSLTASPSAMKGEMGKYLREYAASHQNATPPEETTVESPENATPPEDTMDEFPPKLLNLLPRKGVDKTISRITLDAAQRIFEKDELGSFEPGKRPGLNLLVGLDTENLLHGEKTTVKVLD